MKWLVRPKYTNRPLPLENLEHQPVVDVDTAGVRALQVANKVLE
jgi:hypothetical protein